MIKLTAQNQSTNFLTRLKNHEVSYLDLHPFFHLSYRFLFAK